MRAKDAFMGWLELLEPGHKKRTEAEALTAGYCRSFCIVTKLQLSCRIK